MKRCHVSDQVLNLRISISHQLDEQIRTCGPQLQQLTAEHINDNYQSNNFISSINDL
jgi:hypothetical protein